MKLNPEYTEQIPISGISCHSWLKYFTSMLPVDNSAAAIEKMLSIYFSKFDNVQDKDILTVLNRSVIVPKATQTYTFDDDGNMLTNGKWTYTWNGENRMVIAEKADQKLECAYDYMGRRFSKKVYTGFTGNWTLDKEEKYVYNGYLQIAGFDGSNDTIQKSYCWAGSTTMEWQKDHINSKYHYSLYDANKNIVGTVDDTNTLTSEYEYSPFGKILTKSGSYADSNKFRFSSEYHDDETGLVYYNYRYYDSVLGRWTKRDPFDEKGGFNLYHFGFNNSVLGHDLLGLYWTYKWEKVKNQWPPTFSETPPHNTDPNVKWVSAGRLDGKKAWFMYRRVNDKFIPDNGKGGFSDCMVIIIVSHIDVAVKYSKKLKLGEFTKILPLSCWSGDDSTINGERIYEVEIPDENLVKMDPPITSLIGVETPNGPSNMNVGYNSFADIINTAKENAKKAAKAMAEDCKCKCKEITVYFQLRSRNKKYDKAEKVFVNNYKNIVNSVIGKPIPCKKNPKK
jgi:RHS repeat-associated protein